jgi:hypothetical protein
MRQAGWLGGLALAVLLTHGGCDGSGPPAASSSTEQAKVKGKVTRKGKPLAKVDVKLNPANVNRKSASTVTATTGDDGSYEVTTLVGQNTITLGGATAAKDPKIMYFSKPVDVNAGDNLVDIDIP